MVGWPMSHRDRESGPRESVLSGRVPHQAPPAVHPRDPIRIRNQGTEENGVHDAEHGDGCPQAESENQHGGESE